MPVLQDGELVLYGFVGETYFEQGFTSLDVLDALAEVGSDADITVRMNSGGGYVHEGLAIYNALAAHKGEVTVQIDSIVASSASLIAMAGDRIVMKAGSLIMIHEPSGITFGTAEDHDRTRVALDKMGDAFAGIYADRSGKDAADVRASMKEEIWLGADEAVAEGYADEAETAKAKPVAAFDYRMYAHAPKKLVATARAKNWSLPASMNAASAATTRQQKESSMTDKPKADDPSADLDKARAEAGKAAVASFKARRTAVMSMDAAKGREALADVLIETDMAEDAIKVALEAAPKAVAPTDPEPDAESYAADRAKASGLAAPGKPAVARTLTANMRKLLGKEAA